MDVNSLIAAAQSATADLQDQTQVSEGGSFERETPPAGPTPARFVGYVEVGKRKQRPYQGKPKPDAKEVRLYFELNGPKHQRKVEVEGEERTFTNVVSEKLVIKLNDKAGFTKLFRRMTYGRDGITHMAQMLGQPFLITVVHNTKEKDGKKVTYANIRDAEGTFTVGAPMYTDPMSGESIPVPVPEATVPLKLLLWDAPSKEMWDSIFIDGTRTVKRDGVEVEESKNWLQEDIVQNAVDFEGSALQALLGGLGDLSLGGAEAPAEAPSPAPAPTLAPTPAPAPEAAPAAPTAAPGGDVLASLGLTG